MKSIRSASIILALAVTALSSDALLGSTARGADASPSPECIGVYDSRVIAYAGFWSETGTRRREDLVATARAAKAVADPERSKAAEATLRAFREESHLQVFSTVPVDGILAELAPKLPAILRQADVTRLVSKWDEATLTTCASATQVDMTDALVAAILTPNPKQAETIAAIKRQEPLPLAKAHELMREGRL